jgi:phosphatidylglycerophosphatase GEP4
VLRHSTKKPGCWEEAFELLRRSDEAEVTRPDQVAVVGDRLFTDVIMANMMGSWAVWVRDGVRPAAGVTLVSFFLVCFRCPGKGVY